MSYLPIDDSFSGPHTAPSRLSFEGDKLKRRDLILGIGFMGMAAPSISKDILSDRKSGVMLDVSEAIVYKTPEMFGAVGDGINDDSQYIQMASDWITSQSFRKLVFNPGKIYRITQTIKFEFKKDVFGCCIDMQGAIKPDPDIGDGFILSGVVCGTLNLSVIGDGVNDYKDIPDYSKPSPEGCQQAFVIDSSRATRISCFGYGYKGRVLRTQSTGSIKTSFLEISIWTGDKQLIYKNGICGQAAYLEGGKDAFGFITNAYTNWDAYGSVLYKLTDLTIGHWEYGAGEINPALSIIGCQTVHVVVLSGGVSSGKNAALRISHADDQKSIAINIQRLFLTNGDNNLEIHGAGNDDKDRRVVSIDSFYSYKSSKSSLLINGVSNILVNDIYCDDTDTGVTMNGFCENIKICGYIKNPRKNGILSGSRSYISNSIFSCKIIVPAKNAICIDLSESMRAHAAISDSMLSGAGFAFSLGKGNEIDVIGGSVKCARFFHGEMPKNILNVSGISLSSNGISESASGVGTIIVNHNLTTKPSHINITPLSDNSGYFVSDINEEHFIVNFKDAGNNKPFLIMWECRV